VQQSPSRTSKEEISFPKVDIRIRHPPVPKNINSVRFCETMKAVLILALIIAVCMCSRADLGKESEVSPDVSGSQSNLQKTSDGQKSASGSTQDERRNWRKGRPYAWKEKSPVEEDYHDFRSGFKGDEKSELKRMCEQFQQEEQKLGYALHDTWPPGTKPPFESDVENRIRKSVSHILFGRFAGPEHGYGLFRRAYSYVASYAADTPVDDEVKKVLETLREVYKRSWWSGCNDPQGASGPSEDSQKKENKEGAAKTKWQGMTLNERAYHRFLARFYDSEEKELKEMHGRSEKREKQINLLFAESSGEGRNRSLRSILCHIIGPEMEDEIIQDETIKRILEEVVVVFARRHRITDIKGAEKVLETMWEIAYELGWDLDALKDTS
jgi:hypothetical protein